MATFYTDIGANQNDPKAQNQNTAEREVGSADLTEAVFTADGTEVNGDVIRIFKQAEGSRINAPDVSVVTDGVGGTSAIGDIGDDATPAAIASGVDVTAAGITRANDSGSEALTPVTAAPERWINFTLTTLTAAMTPGQKIVFRIPATKA
jgi:hypothetical protein